MVEEETRPDYVVVSLLLKNNKEVKDTPQDTPPDTNKVARKEQKKKLLLEFCEEPKTVTEILRFLGLKDRKNVVEGYINPMLAEGILAMTEPDKPTSGNQKYFKVGK